jgi:Protein of unknown function (DUF3551)
MSITIVNRTSQHGIAARRAERWHPPICNELTTEGDYHAPFAKIGARAEAAKRRIIFAAVVVLAAVVFSLQPAKAYEAPWCAVTSGGDGDMHWDCQYRSIEECRPNVLAGNRGWCNPSPYFVAPSRPPEHRHYRQRQTRPQ